jgi:simple sugar transport system substrate-binding protein
MTVIRLTSARLGVAAALIMVLLGLSLTACGGGDGDSGDAKATSSGKGNEEQLRFVAVSHGQSDDPFHSIVRNGLDSAAEQMGVDLEYNAPGGNYDPIAQRQLIERAVASKPDGIIGTMPDIDALAPALKEAVDAGIPVILINSGQSEVKATGALTYIGQDEFEAGRQAGLLMKDQGVHKVLCLNPEVGNVVLDQRCDGFKETTGAEMKILAVDFEPTNIQQRLTAALQSDPQVDGILSGSAVPAEAALPVLDDFEQKGRKIALGTFDLSPGVLEAVENGKILYAMDQQPFLYAYEAVVQLANWIRYQVKFPALAQTTGTVVTKDNAADVIDLSEQGVR